MSRTNTNSKSLTGSRLSVVLLVIAAALLLISAVGGTQAALNYYSDTYKASVSASKIGVALVEYDPADEEYVPIAWRDYISDDEWDTQKGTIDTKTLEGDEFTTIWRGELNLPELNKDFAVGRTYDERIAVRNTGQIDQYVRVKLYKYWEDEKGNKIKTVSPDLIEIKYANNDLWLEDIPDPANENGPSPERSIFYYRYKLDSGRQTPDLTESITINQNVANKVDTKPSEDGKTMITKYEYDGLYFCLEVEVDAVQDHNGQGAIRSAWGDANVKLVNGEIRLG